MTKFKKILLVLLALIVILVMVGALMSKHYECSRHVAIRAPAEKIYALIGDLKAWPQWEPFSAESLRKNKQLKTTLGSKTSGVGASQTWEEEGGSGRLTFTGSDPTTGIDYDLVFTNLGHDSPAKSWIHMAPRPDGTVDVIWGVNGEMNLPVVGSYFAKFSDSMMGPMFEKGLENLRLKAEAK
jgi:hypothetical protein